GTAGATGAWCARRRARAAPPRRGPRSRRPPRPRGGPSSREPVVEAQVRPHPGGDRETRLLRPRQPDLRPEDVVVPEHDAAEELLVDEPHRLGGRERLAVLLGEEEARPAVVLARARALEGHHLPERLGAAAGPHVLLAAAVAPQVRGRA